MKYERRITLIIGIVASFFQVHVSSFTSGSNVKISSKNEVGLPFLVRGRATLLSSTTDEPSTVGEDTQPVDTKEFKQRTELKKSLLALGASYDRGFGATPSSRTQADSLISQLSTLNPTSNPSYGIDGNGDQIEYPPPLEGAWRMVWCTAQDVLLLAASPLTTVGAIYQVIEPPVATNIIDFIPRAQALLPPGTVPTLIRAEVTTRASSRASLPDRIGLVFEKVKIQPVEIFGVSVKDVLPPVGWTFPNVSELLKTLGGFDEENSPGFFDVLYVDEELLIIKQNEPGGVFALTKVQNYDP